MKRLLLLSLGALVALGTGAPAWAVTYYEQTFVPYEPVHWHLEVGYSPTAGQTSEYLEGGFTFGGGYTWEPQHSPLALRADFDYSYFRATRNLIALNERLDQIQIDDGHGELFGLSLDGQYRVRLARASTGYAFAGVGVHHLRIALTQTVAVGTYLCDPWLGYCQFGLGPGDEVVASSDSTRFSWNAGIGLAFALRNRQTLFFEARYVRLQSSQPTEFVPLTVGLRF